MIEGNDRPDKINMLLDVDSFSGTHRGKMAPVIMFFLLAGAPALFAVYYLVGHVNLFYLLPFYIPYVIRVGLKTIGNEKKRVEEYKRQLNDEYSSSLDLINIKTRHNDGCIEYVKNRVAYCVVASNGNIDDEVYHAQMVRKFIDNIADTYDMDILVQNVTASDELSSRYDGIKLFGDKEVAKDYIALIDHNRKIISEDSRLTEVIFVVMARKKEHKRLREDIESAVASKDAKAFRSLYIADKEKVEVIIQRDIDAYIDFEDMQVKKYAKGNYYKSKVEGYDLEEETYKEKEVEEERGFMVHE